MNDLELGIIILFALLFISTFGVIYQRSVQAKSPNVVTQNRREIVKRYKEKSPQPNQFFSFRRILIDLHIDLFSIERKIVYYEGEYKLSDLELLVLVLEDGRFLSHSGVDFRACCRELIKAIAGLNHGGASTIDMQFVRTATGFKERTVRRKIREILLSKIIQYRYTKRMILRSYLDCAFLGSHLIGIENAAIALFGVSRENLSLQQSAELAAMLVYPKPLKSTEAWLTNIRRRAQYGCRRMPGLKKRLEQVPR